MAANSTASATIAEHGALLPLHRLDLDTYNRMVDSGALEGQPVELLDGVLVEMSPKSPAHVKIVNRLMRHFAGAPKWWLQVQDPIEVPPDCEPEPDLAVCQGEPPQGHHHRAALLVIEVAVTSQHLDREVKAPLYARAGIPTYWLVDVPARVVEVRTDPGRRGYRRCERVGAGATLACALEGVAEIELNTLFGGLES
ncbi:MAG: Uma2 family endonuclease [Solirubrobacterales bacterium]|nr:Uma2 family endonuclease [Solirubrobacterales bacterium]